MARAINRLTVKGAAALKEPGLHADGGGLYVNVKKSGARSFVFVFQWKGKRREKGLGSLTLVSLDEARAKRDEARKLLADGIDPLEPKAAANDITFGEVATSLIRDLETGWSNPKHRQQWRNTLANYCAPIWETPVDAVDTDALVAILKPMWNDKPETASRLRARIERVLDAAKVRGLRSGDNPAQWRSHLAHILPARTRGAGVRHHPALPYAQVPDFVKGLKTRVSTAARALEFLIHTAARTSEVLNMTWGEVNLNARLWTVPGERMKMRREHLVPLTEPALVVLRAMAVVGTDPAAPVFPSRNGKPLSGMSMEMLLRRMQCDDFTVHGMRSSFRDWAGDETAFPREIVEMALAHIVGNAVEQAYRRGTALAKRRDLMEAWSAFVAGSPALRVSA
ncbi:integrase arm-type DNA-binding domain-containing protein [Sphingomonas sp. LY29]|uniref:tyrosine-type recombinase/integrase n=1 Tax=Sphingomonas sp. LY29 TaxID=3095341 RepID=UPI002D787DC2|nr:integrase arm-type DNA-binding domain-containing protein [Sphingomonas sp. LY29]WRP25136.1 integrase arm-type DNA-binding domain-containing protein [Sphingomonas sp. LY29]